MAHIVMVRRQDYIIWARVHLFPCEEDGSKCFFNLFRILDMLYYWGPPH